ncbi:hypothetical protein Srot_1872 [Segniliparus rotundus DSM 44985]|uniref:Uncharacterized protein n=1 Tax=Segniliparus rotundus (strain ATCC BAA-972 / CDC 1076 / CIP 108378 / DSM 44985 / JCM 13578) TaxID=640132 RepID=D6Z8Q2_SEGRD|nr:hypothetical protein Srot_1872 [Segniliparus rotundus DSM 44985]
MQGARFEPWIHFGWASVSANILLRRGLDKIPGAKWRMRRRKACAAPCAHHGSTVGGAAEPSPASEPHGLRNAPLNRTGEHRAHRQLGRVENTKSAYACALVFATSLPRCSTAST